MWFIRARLCTFHLRHMMRNVVSALNIFFAHENAFLSFSESFVENIVKKIAARVFSNQRVCWQGKYIKSR